MLASTSVSKQEADEKNGDFEAKRATVVAEKANVERLQALESFKRIVAPFAGVITSRKTDIGALINAGSGNGPELFRLADTHKLRVYVEVPQTYASQIQVGMHADLKLPELQGSTYPATVASTSNAINPTSRTLLVQLEADNAHGKLIAGSYADVRFDLPAAAGVLQLPVTALMFRQHGLKVATIGADGHVVMKNVQLGRDFGTRVEVVDGTRRRRPRASTARPTGSRRGDPVQARPEPAKKAAASKVDAVPVVAASGADE